MSYYNIDSILAEEDLVPCTTLFEFSHLGHLGHINPSSHNHSHHETNDPLDITKATTSSYLPEKTKLQMPLWSIEKWSHLGYIQIHLPRSLNAKALERMVADPLAVNLRKRHCHFFRWAHKLISLLEQSTTPTHASREQPWSHIRQILLQTLTGPRLRSILNWSWSSSEQEEDVSSFLQPLDDMEQDLYRAGASGMGAHYYWKQYTCRLPQFTYPCNMKRRTAMSQSEGRIRKDREMVSLNGDARLEKRQRVSMQ